MIDNAARLARTSATYYPYVEPTSGAGKGLLAALAASAAQVVTDDATYFFLSRMQRAAAKQLDCRFEVVDSNGMYPIRATERVFTTAASFRRHLQKELPAKLAALPDADTLEGRALPGLATLPVSIEARWPRANLLATSQMLADLEIDHSVPATSIRGGPRAAQQALLDFVDDKLGDYSTLRNQPSADCQSHLSAYLHFGHIAASDVFLAIASREDWSPARLADRATGSRINWWGMSSEAEGFLDQLITWRELGLNAATHDAHYTEYRSLPAWAQATLGAHASDPRPDLYSHEQIESASTHDRIWNATQTQLVRDGGIHNYLRMLWGKKILEWSPSPQLALQRMIELNNKYALDGRDPNSYSGIFWILGRYDRAWGPERPIFGKVRYMSSDNTARKLRLGRYLETFARE